MKLSTPHLALLLGVIAVSFAAIFIRVSQEEGVPSLVIAAGRLIIASLILTPIALTRYPQELRQLERRDLLFCLLSGAVLAVHFATWISSLEFTSVVASVVLVTTNPLFVALLSLPLLGERVSRPVAIGIVLAFIGGVIVAISGDAGDPPTRSAPLLGNALAIMGALAASIYLLIGRRVRGKLSLIPYIWLVYGTGALVLATVVLLSNLSFFGYSTLGYLGIVAMAIFPQLLGHSSFNYALGHLPAAFVSLVILVEPIGSAILAIIFLGEVPGELVIVGAAFILVGVGVATRRNPT